MVLESKIQINAKFSLHSCLFFALFFGQSIYKYFEILASAWRGTVGLFLLLKSQLNADLRFRDIQYRASFGASKQNTSLFKFGWEYLLWGKFPWVSILLCPYKRGLGTSKGLRRGTIKAFRRIASINQMEAIVASPRTENKVYGTVYQSVRSISVKFYVWMKHYPVGASPDAPSALMLGISSCVRGGVFFFKG